MALLHRDEFKAQLGAVRLFVIQATPSSALDSSIKLIYERTSKILDAHARGLELVTVLNRAKLYWDEGEIKASLEGIDSLPEERIKEWGSTVSYVVENIRSVKFRMILLTQLTTTIEIRRYLQFPYGILNSS